MSLRIDSKSAATTDQAKQGASSLVALLNSSPSPAGTNTDAATFQIKLEDFIDTYRRGNPDRTSTVPQELSSREADSNNQLLQGDFKARVVFGLYSTALTYSERARFVAGVSETSDLQQKLAAAEQQSGDLAEKLGVDKKA